jgi:hypothetical protein
MPGQRLKTDLDAAFDVNATLDRATPSTMPEPGVRNPENGT